MEENTFHAPADARGFDFKKIKLRELTGKDDVSVAKRCKGIDDPWLRQMERVRVAIVEVDGKPVPQPFEEFDLWRERSRLLAQAAYAKVNGIDAAAASGFLEGSGGSSPTPSQP